MKNCKPKYANGYTVGVGTGEVYFRFALDKITTADIRISYHHAKTLSQHLAHTIAEMETKTGAPVLDTAELNELLFGKKEGEQRRGSK